MHDIVISSAYVFSAATLLHSAYDANGAAGRRKRVFDPHAWREARAHVATCVTIATAYIFHAFG